MEAVFVTPVLLTVVRYPMLVETVLLTVRIDPEFPRLVSCEPSPQNFPYRVPAEIVVKNPYVVEIEYVEILLAVNKPVLNNVVLRTGGNIDIPPVAPTIPVRPDPSPQNFPQIPAEEIVVNNPQPVFISTELSEVATTSGI